MSEAGPSSAAKPAADEDEAVRDDYMDLETPAEGAGEDDEEDVVEMDVKDEATAPKALSEAQREAMRKAAMEAEQEAKRLREEQEAALAAVREREAAVGKQSRLEYLMKQTDVFTHFMTGGEALGDGRGKKGGKKGPMSPSGRRGTGRMSEKQEDRMMMAAAQKDRTFRRLDQQPNIIVFGTMRKYQLEGLNWMIRLHDANINGVLADEMGLGKTLQTISLLAYLRETRGITGPHLVIVPKTTMGNWKREFARWCPSISVVSLKGAKPERAEIIKDQINPGNFDVLLTSYEQCIIEKAAIKKHKFRYLCIDEAHRIKNEKSKLSIVVREFSVTNRLLITGTPLQNNLHELWALLNFLLPDVFTSSEDFDSWFDMDGDPDGVIKKLQGVLRPFLLRRLKADVAKDLPPKIETMLHIGLTKMQKFWYTKVLTKDATALNALGGPDRVRLLNILMQLRKVCNHPYLFDGAEPGPPFINGPHLWLSTGKMVMLDKLLTKLKAQGSRVLIFSQMTRMLDIMEDYMMLRGHEYNRIDGSTKGDDRDNAMDEFNAPGSSKFAFLLSTRAGGLGINLATADTVIIYDSDWNPQVDLQAMDRAHRIGQTKTVRVFRFVSEGTVEEKVIERANRKLYLDAAVIQQGRLMAQNKSLSKEELVATIKFGADAIFASKDATITDEDIDAILAKGEERTREHNSKIKTDMQHNLANFTLSSADDGGSVYDWGGLKDDAGAMLMPLPQRERKRNYDVNEYFRETMASSSGPSKPREPRQPKGITMQDFQFFDKAAVDALSAKEFELAKQSRERRQHVKDLRGQQARHRRQRTKSGDGAAGAPVGEELSVKEEADRLEKEIEDGKFELSPAEQEQKMRLIEAGFGDWHKRDLKSFLSACERFGRAGKTQIYKAVSEETGKTEGQVRAYYTVFWGKGDVPGRYKEIGDWSKHLDKIQKGEQRIERNHAIERALRTKVARHKNPWQTLRLQYGSNKGKAYTEEEDIFLVCKMNEIGYGNWEALKIAVRQAWQFKFDWFIKSRTPGELQRRCETLVRLVEKENEAVESAAKSSAKGKKRAQSAAGGASKKKKK
eukprot:g5591.t1